jgi:Fe-S-cluster containining protein
MAMISKVDTTEIENLALQCTGKFAFCCLCSPALLDEELEKLPSKIKKFLGPAPFGDASAAIQLRGGGGSCSLLENNRCIAYDDRPHFCRQFPVQLFSGWRLQSSVIRSCRGVNSEGKGEPLKNIINKEMKRLGKKYYDEALEDTRNAFEELSQISDLYIPPEELKPGMGSMAAGFMDPASFIEILEPGEVAGLGSEEEAREYLLELTWPSIEETFSENDLINLPIYTSEECGWTIFRLKNRIITGNRLHEEGKLEKIDEINSDELGLLPFSDDGRKAFLEYISNAVSRDAFYGAIAYLTITEDMPMAVTGPTLVTQAVTDLWWRAGLLSRWNSRDTGKTPDRLDARDVGEAIIFFDADLLDLPVLGGYI